MRRLVSLIWLCLGAAVQPAPAHAEPLLVFAAASLTDALRDVDRLWQQQGHAGLRLSFAASSTLARHLNEGAAASVFASADKQWMDWAVARNLIAADTRRDVLGNALVLVVPRGEGGTRPAADTLPRDFDFGGLLGPDGRLAVGDPSNVPAGIYARQALTQLGWWSRLAPRLAGADSVRAALLLVERGEARAGIVYATDALASSGVAVLGAFPAETHDKITYPFAVVRAGDSAEARTLLDFLAGFDAKVAFRKRGFVTE